jgi:hypothetical protein
MMEEYLDDPCSPKRVNSRSIVRARTPAFGLIDIRVVIIGIRLQTWMRVIVGVGVL